MRLNGIGSRDGACDLGPANQSMDFMVCSSKWSRDPSWSSKNDSRDYAQSSGKRLAFGPGGWNVEGRGWGCSDCSHLVTTPEDVAAWGVSSRGGRGPQGGREWSQHLRAERWRETEFCRHPWTPGGSLYPGLRSQVHQ